MTYSPLLAAYQAGQRFLSARAGDPACDGCGCTQDNACVGPSGPCWWVDTGDAFGTRICSMCSGDHPDAPRRNQSLSETLL